MTKLASNKKLKKTVSTDGDNGEFDATIFDIHDRHYSSLIAIKKKIRACEKKIRELEQVDQIRTGASTNNKNTSHVESEIARKERLDKIELKKLYLSIWKEAAMCIHSVRKEELAQGISNVSMADVAEGIELLKQVAEKGDKWDHYKCPNKKHLQKSEIERIRNLAHYLNIHPDSSSDKLNAKSNFLSFSSVVDYLTSPIAIGQECPMSFTEFVRLFDKVRKTLTVEIVVKMPEVKHETIESVSSPAPVQSENATAIDAEKPADVTETVASYDAMADNKQREQVNKNRSKRPYNRVQRFDKRHHKYTNLNDPSNGSLSVQSVPEKLVVVVTSNAKNKPVEDTAITPSSTHPITVSSEDVSKQSINNMLASEKIVANGRGTPKETLPGSLIHNPNVPFDDSDDDEWLTAGVKHKKGTANQQQRQSSLRGARRGGNYKPPTNSNKDAGYRGSAHGNNTKRGSNSRTANFRGGRNYQASHNRRTISPTHAIGASVVSATNGNAAL